MAERYGEIKSEGKMRRRKLPKRYSKRLFNRTARRVKRRNYARPMRGGYRI